MPKKKKKKKERCTYCIVYNSISNYTIGERGVIEKLCPVLKENVTKNTEACDKFELAKYFWCVKCENWLEIIVCISRQNKKKEGCQRCRQGKIIQYLWENYENS